MGLSGLPCRVSFCTESPGELGHNLHSIFFGLFRCTTNPNAVEDLLDVFHSSWEPPGYFWRGGYSSGGKSSTIFRNPFRKWSLYVCWCSPYRQCLSSKFCLDFSVCSAALRHMLQEAKPKCLMLLSCIQLFLNMFLLEQHSQFSTMAVHILQWRSLYASAVVFRPVGFTPLLLQTSFLIRFFLVVIFCLVFV